MSQHVERLLYGIAAIAGVLGVTVLGVGLVDWIAGGGFAVPLVLILMAGLLAYAVGWLMELWR